MKGKDSVWKDYVRGDGVKGDVSAYKGESVPVDLEFFAVKNFSPVA